MTASPSASASAPSASAAQAGAGAQPATEAQGGAAAHPGGEQAGAPAQAGSEQAGAAAQGSAAAATPQVDEEAAHRNLTAARDTLNQLTQLPAAAQLTGEARTQIAQLISNFNELITAQSNWRTSYAKVAANLDAVLGPENTDAEATGGAAANTSSSPGSTTGATASTTPATPGASGASGATAPEAGGAVGTSGTATATVDPAIRAKLVEMRRHLTEFEKASGGR